MKGYVLTKDDPITVYFKCIDKTGHTFTDSKKDAMVFDIKSQAINYNHRVLFGEFEAVDING